MRKPRSRRARAGFTIIELLVVIAIIAILIGILIPVLSKVRERGRIAVCQSNLRQLCVAWTSYATDHFGEIVVPFGWANRTNDNSSLYGYLRNFKVTFCPTYPDNRSVTYAINDYLNAGSSVTPILTIDKVKNPSQTFSFIDYDGGPSEFSVGVEAPPLAWISVPCYWHYGTSLGFVDGHAEFMKYSDSRTRDLRKQGTRIYLPQPDNPDLQRLAAMVKPE